MFILIIQSRGFNPQVLEPGGHSRGLPSIPCWGRRGRACLANCNQSQDGCNHSLLAALGRSAGRRLTIITSRALTRCKFFAPALALNSPGVSLVLGTQEDTETQRDGAQGHPVGLRLPSSCSGLTVSLQDRPREKGLPVTRESVLSFGQRKGPGAGFPTDQRLLSSLSQLFFTLGPVQIHL